MTEPITSPSSSRILRASIWVAIGALIAAALVCVVWVLIGDDNGIVGKAFLTIVLLAAFAGVAIAESSFASRRPAWLALASMGSWVIVLLIGAFLIWMPTGGHFGVGAERFFRFVLIVLVVQGALLHARLLIAAHLRHHSTFTAAATYVSVALVVIIAIMLILPLLLSEVIGFLPIYWRVVVALAILAAVGTALVPLVNALLAPKKPRPVAPGRAGYASVGAPPAWPTYADGRTPLPVLPDGSPDWQAYYTGRPTYAPYAAPAVESAPASSPATPADAAAAPWYDGFPPPPPVPRQPSRD